MIFLGIGSNMGNRLSVMKEAVSLLESQGVTVLDRSAIFETPAWGGEASGSFLNAVFQVGFSGTAPELLDLLLESEIQLGRQRTVKWGNRIIDLDILEFHREVWDHPRLHLPHPEYPTRSFVLVPMADLVPWFVPTGKTESISELLLSCEVSDIQRVTEKDWL